MAGKGIADGIEQRRRWVVVPSWGRALLVLRTALAPLLDRGSYDTAAEADALFLKDVEERGAQAASTPVGRGRSGGAEGRAGDPARRRGGQRTAAAAAEADARPSRARARRS